MLKSTALPPTQLCPQHKMSFRPNELIYRWGANIDNGGGVVIRKSHFLLLLYATRPKWNQIHTPKRKKNVLRMRRRRRQRPWRQCCGPGNTSHFVRIDIVYGINVLWVCICAPLFYCLFRALVSFYFILFYSLFRRKKQSSGMEERRFCSYTPIK